MNWLAIAASFVAWVEGERVARSIEVEAGPGAVDRLAAALGEICPTLGGGGGDPPRIRPEYLGKFDAIAALVGPGGFTGVRAGLSLAHGLSLGSGCPLVGATVGEAIRFGLGWTGPLWVVTDARRGTVYLEGDGPARSVALDAIALADPAPLLAGDMAGELAGRLARRGILAPVAEPPGPGPLGLARAARARLEGRLEPLPVLPLYVDSTETSLPSATARPTTG